MVTQNKEDFCTSLPRVTQTQWNSKQRKSCKQTIVKLQQEKSCNFLNEKSLLKANFIILKNEVLFNLQMGLKSFMQVALFYFVLTNQTYFFVPTTGWPKTLLYTRYIILSLSVKEAS